VTDRLLAAPVINRQTAGEGGNGFVVDDVINLPTNPLELVAKIFLGVAVQTPDFGHLNPPDHLTHFNVLALVKHMLKLGLSDQYDPQQLLVAVLQFIKPLQVLQSLSGQVVGLFNNQTGLIPGTAAIHQNFLHLPGFLFQTKLRLFL